MRQLFSVFSFALMLTFFVSKNLLPPGFFNTQDNMHPLRLVQYELCRKDGQFPCRYVQQLGLNCGYPLFNFYSPASYELALGIRTISLYSLSFLSSIKAFYILSTFLGILGIFLLSNLLSKNLPVSFLSTTLYALAPYKSVNLYVRGAFAEYFLLAIIPWLIYFLLSWSNSFTRRLFYVLFLAITILSHNLFPILFGPIFFVFIIYKLWTLRKRLHLLKIFLFDTLLGFLLTAFFIIPALLERGYTTNQLMSSGYFSFINHFISIRQLFLNSYWGYGPSVWGNLDGMSFQLGPIHIISVLLSLIYCLFGKTPKKMYIFMCVLLSFFAFLTHNRSTFLWQTVPLLSYVQFPWRFLGPSIFLVSILVSLQIRHKTIIFYLILSCIIFYPRLFHSGNWNRLETDQTKFTNNSLFDQQSAGLGDYWPSFGKNLPAKACNNFPVFLSGQGSVQNFSKTTDLVTGNVITNTGSIIVLPLVYFPGWKISLNQSELSIPTYEPDLGLITINLPAGQNTFKLIYAGTTLQHFSNYISLLTFFFVISYLFLTTWQKK